LLKEFGFGATFFICKFLPNFKDTSKYMNWQQIRKLNRVGFEVANRTRTHAAVSLLSGIQFIGELNYIEDNHFKVIALKDLANYINVKKAMKTIIPDLNKKLKN